VSSRPNIQYGVFAVSAKMPQTYILHSVAIAIVIAVVMVLFLMHVWG
jgi:hypothetical protein